MAVSGNEYYQMAENAVEQAEELAEELDAIYFRPIHPHKCHGAIPPLEDKKMINCVHACKKNQTARRTEHAREIVRVIYDRWMDGILDTIDTNPYLTDFDNRHRGFPKWVYKTPIKLQAPTDGTKNIIVSKSSAFKRTRKHKPGGKGSTRKYKRSRRSKKRKSYKQKKMRRKRRKRRTKKNRL